ncbi:MAG: PAS domain-containing sensor histidine kinase [Desulfobaccales bacterium]|nr:PAS domain-containing sensor histidine kinase [Desulfobaccales bacterium]
MSSVEPSRQPQPHDWSHFIIQNTPGGIITVDGQGRITEFNPAAEALTGYTRQEALGRFCREVLHCEGCDQDCFPSMVVRDQKEVTRELLVTNRASQKVPVMLSAFALRDDEGRALGGVFIIRDLTPIKRLEKERRYLVNMFAHDLKTPVVGMAGLVQRLVLGKAGPLSQGQMTYLQTIAKEMRRLEKLINNFLEFARLDLHILTPMPSALQVEKECQEVMTLLLPLAEAKSIDLQAQFPQEVLVLPADPLLFRRVLENLLENAIKYSPAKTKVYLKVQREGPEARFAVKDQGPGIPAEDLPHLFEIFYRGTETGKEPGFGLGLATVKRIIDAHGGRIWVDTAEGKGTTFFFTLPLGIQEGQPS